MKLKNKYIKCFTKEKCVQLKLAGYKFLYENNGTYFFEENNDITVNFSDNSDLLEDTKTSMWINL